MFQTLTANRVGTQRQEVLAGRNYIVIPVRMIREGVLNGSRGPLLYQRADIKRSVQAWNNMPIVVNHPKEGGRFISARRPDILNKVGVGFIFNAKCEGESLEAEAWIDIARLQAVNPGLASRVSAGQPVEVSTGLGTENEPTEGVHNGRNFTHIARNFAPDHLALLPDEQGACSIQDGCGLAVNKTSLSEIAELVTNYNASGTKKTFSEWLAGDDLEFSVNCGDKPDCNCGCKGKKPKADDKPEQLDFVPTSNTGTSIELDFQPST